MNANATFLTSALNKTNIGFALLKNLCGILRALEAAATLNYASKATLAILCSSCVFSVTSMFIFKFSLFCLIIVIWSSTFGVIMITYKVQTPLFINLYLCKVEGFTWIDFCWSPYIFPSKFAFQYNISRVCCHSIICTKKEHV